MDFPTLPLSKKRILIVESDDVVRSSIARILEIEGYSVYQAHSTALAIRFIQQLPPDLIISDINIPGPDALLLQSESAPRLDFYQLVRSNPTWTATPFIFLISSDHPHEIRRARQLGVEDYLSKPIDPDYLVRIVHARLLRSVELQVALIDQAYLETIEVLANTVEGRDPYTHGHIGRVSTYAMWMAQAMSWPADQLRNLAFGARLHDIGKIVIPDHILKKPGELSGDEWELMKQHPSAGGRILRAITHLNNALNYVLYHHERWDGSGYPHGLAGRDIPIEGRLLAIADVYDALTTDRPYHPAMPHAEVMQFIHERAGADFDPDLVPIFIRTFNTQMRV